MRVNRELLLQELESVQPGLSPREIVEQSSCFIFRDGNLLTFNDEIACRRGTSLRITGAVAAAPLIAMLQKLSADDVEVECKKESLLITSKNKRSSIRMEQEILLPIDTIEPPKGWKLLHEDFAEAVDMAQQCASDNEKEFVICCVHITPFYIEAFDNYQLTRYQLETGVRENVIVRSTSIKHIVSLGMTEFCETDSWMHFRNKQSGLIFSCRRWINDEYPSLDDYLKLNGSNTLILPKGIGEACDRAEVFSGETEKNEVKVEIRKGVMRLKGQGPLGWYQEVKKIQYNGESIEFYIGPKLLVQITNRANECIISPEKLKIDAGKVVYVASVGLDEQEDEQDETSESE